MINFDVVNFLDNMLGEKQLLLFSVILENSIGEKECLRSMSRLDLLNRSSSLLLKEFGDDIHSLIHKIDDFTTSNFL